MTSQRIPDVKSLFKSAPQIKLLSLLWSDRKLQGAYKSAFKGVGLAFKDIREYSPGDDIKHMDWNALARTGTPHIKCFEEERELSIILCFDCSASMDFGTRVRTKKELAALFAATVAFNAVRQGDRIGALLFGPGFERFLPAGRGLSHAMATVDSYLKTPMPGGRSDPERVLSLMNHAYKRRSIVFWISDFIDSSPPPHALAVVAKHHDLIPVVVRDPVESELPDSGIIAASDPDSVAGLGMRPFTVDTDNAELRTRYGKLMGKLDAELVQRFRDGGVEPIWLRTDKQIIDALRRYMARHGRRREPGGRNAYEPGNAEL